MIVIIANADDPVFRECNRSAPLMDTGCLAGAYHRARRRRDPVAGTTGSYFATNPALVISKVLSVSSSSRN